MSRFDTLAAFCVSLLSKRCLELWKLTPLNLDDSQFGDRDAKWRIKILKRIIAAHPGPVGRVSLSFITWAQITQLETPFRKPEFDGLGVLILDFPVKWIMKDRKVLPSFVLRFRSVRMLRLSRSIFGQHTSINSPCLIDLQLRWVRISQDALQQIVNSCSKIETLALLWNSGYRSLSLNPLHKLQSLFVRLNADDNHDEVELEDLEIGDSKELKKLYINQYAFGPTVRIPAGTDLQMLGYFGLETPRLEIGNLVFQQSIAVTLVDYIPSVKILALKMLHTDEYGVGHISDFLYCFPCLEVLHITFVDDTTYCYPQSRSVGRESKYDPHGAIECFKHTLRTVALWDCLVEHYLDDDTDNVPINICNYFIEKDLALETLLIGTRIKLKIESMEAECRNWYEQRTRPFKVCLALSQEGNLTEMRQGDPFSLLGTVYHEIVVMPHAPNEDGDCEDAESDGDDEEKNNSLDGDNDENLGKGDAGPSDSPSSAPSKFGSETMSSQETNEHVQSMKNEDLLSKSEDNEDAMRLSVPVQREGFLKNAGTRFQARQSFKNRSLMSEDKKLLPLHGGQSIEEFVACKVEMSFVGLLEGLLLRIFQDITSPFSPPLQFSLLLARGGTDIATLSDNRPSVPVWWGRPRHSVKF